MVRSGSTITSADIAGEAVKAIAADLHIEVQWMFWLKIFAQQRIILRFFPIFPVASIFSI